MCWVFLNLFLTNAAYFKNNGKKQVNITQTTNMEKILSFLVCFGSESLTLK